RIAGAVGRNSLPDDIALARELIDISDDQIVFRFEMAIERHLVGQSCIHDRFDADGVQSVAVEKIACNEQNTLAWWPRRKRGDATLAIFVEQSCVHRPLDEYVTDRYLYVTDRSRLAQSCDNVHSVLSAGEKTWGSVATDRA